jgi:hypothetical protein
LGGIKIYPHKGRGEVYEGAPKNLIIKELIKLLKVKL